MGKGVIDVRTRMKREQKPTATNMMVNTMMRCVKLWREYGRRTSKLASSSTIFQAVQHTLDGDEVPMHLRGGLAKFYPILNQEEEEPPVNLMEEIPETVVGINVKVTGKLAFDTLLRIDGTVEGELISKVCFRFMYTVSNTRCPILYEVSPWTRATFPNRISSGKLDRRGKRGASRGRE